jgi:WD40 repeat protein
LWDLASGKERAVLRAKELYFVELYFYSNYSSAVAFAPDGKLLATGRTGRAGTWVCLRNAITGQVLSNLADVDPARLDLYSLALSGDGKLLAGAHGPVVKVWDVATRKVRHRFAGHSRQVYAVAFSPDGLTLASGSADGTVRLWDPTAPPRRK